MGAMITPVSMWKNLDCGLDLNPVSLRQVTNEGVKIEYLRFQGRDTGEGRVSGYAAYAESVGEKAGNAVLILPDSDSGICEDVIKMFATKGYCVCMLDYRGKGYEDEYTVYPDNVAYANAGTCGRFKDHVDESADKTSWYEWGALALYAKKLLLERAGCTDAAVIGIRDGGEIAWKILSADKFSCAVTVSAAGWLAYRGFEKFNHGEPALNDERYRFIAGIDSQAYAPYVKCPVLMLCSVNDPKFDYDRAFDTFSRINAAYADESAIAFSVNGNGYIDVESTQTMFMFLDKFVRNRQVFIPHPSDVSIATDDDQNLTAEAKVDSRGRVESCKLYFAEDSLNSTIREWREVSGSSDGQGTFLFNPDVYSRSSVVFAFCGTKYSNGFTVWSRIISRKISGIFKNSKPACRVLYSGKDGVDCFTVADYSRFSTGNIFLNGEEAVPRVVKKLSIAGLYSPCGLATYRTNSSRYAPAPDSILKLDVFTESKAEVRVGMRDVVSGELFVSKIDCLGGVWQSTLLECRSFKNEQGVALPSFTLKLRMTVVCGAEYAVNNVMWL